MKLRSLLFALALSVVFAAAPLVALAATTYNVPVAGREIFATPTLGVFVGIASGDLPGQWSAAVEHTLLSPNATITGGRFVLATRLGGEPAAISGTFSGGTVTQTDGFSGCVNQVYAIDGTLANVGANGGTGTGTFRAVLTHLRTTFFRRCITYGARVAGSVSLTF